MEIFFSLIPPQTLKSPEKRSKAFTTRAKVKPDYLILIHEKLWSVWRNVEEVLQYSKADREQSFLRFLEEDYSDVIDEECERAKGANSSVNVTFHPLVNPDVNASLSEKQQREELMEQKKQ